MSNAMRVLILLLLAFAGLLVTGVATIALGLASIDVMRLTIILQDVLVFIVPAILCALICYRQPWRLLAVDRRPTWLAFGLVVAVWLVSMPAMNWVVEWNKNLHLPASLAALEQSIRQMEEAAEQLTEQLLQVHSMGELLMGALVIGVMAGVSEELFFRGAMLGIMRQGRCNTHIVVWTVAIIFSAIHMQFLGFVPRLLLGAWLGYLLVWSRSLWVPIIAHSLNNSAVVVATWLDNNGYIDGNALDQMGLAAPGELPWVALVSAAVTALLIVMGCKLLSRSNTGFRI